MTDVLAVVETGDGAMRVLQTASAVDSLLGTDLRTMSLSAGASPAREVERVLIQLAAPQTILGVLAVRQPPQGLCWQVAQRAHKPIIVVPDTGRAGPRPIGRVLVPLDGSLQSGEAVAATLALLADAGVDLVVLHVFVPDTVPQFWDHPEHAQRAWQAEFLARYCPQPGVRLQLRTGEPGERVLDVAEEADVDMIALGWSQHLDEGRARTVQHTVHAAHVPVMLVPLATTM